MVATGERGWQADERPPIVDLVANDEALLAAWRDGNKEAGSALFERYYDALARFFANKAGLECADLVQRTFLALVEARARFRGDASFRTFLFATARNVLFKHYRTKRRAPELDFAVTAIFDLGPSPSSLVARRHEQRLLLEALRRIPLEAQIVLELGYWEAMTGKEIAAVLGIPEGTARSRMRRAKQLLAAKLRELAESVELLESTLGDLDSWAAGLRPSPESQ